MGVFYGEVILRGRVIFSSKNSNKNVSRNEIPLGRETGKGCVCVHVPPDRLI